MPVSVDLKLRNTNKKWQTDIFKNQQNSFCLNQKNIQEKNRNKKPQYVDIFKRIKSICLLPFFIHTLLDHSLALSLYILFLLRPFFISVGCCCFKCIYIICVYACLPLPPPFTKFLTTKLMLSFNVKSFINIWLVFYINLLFLRS